MKPTILVVDDSQTTRSIIRQELLVQDFEIIEAENGVEAIQKAKDFQPDLITIDVDMPEMNGYDAVFNIRTELGLKQKDSEKPLPIVFITANDTLDGRRMGYEVGATEFIIKPFIKGEVLGTVNKLLKKGGSLEGTTVLVVEDSSLSLGILNGILQAEGVTTLLASDGVEAFDIMRDDEENIDLVLTDLIMSDMNGDELCRKIRNELGNKMVPVIIISGVSESGFVLDLFKSGASDYIVKPFAKEELLARIKAHLNSSLLTRQLGNQVIELKRLGKLKDEILSITSHDIRSPLNGIIGFTDLVMQDKSIGNQNLEFLRKVKDSGDFLLNLINDILDLGRAQSEQNELEFIPISIIDIVEASINTVLHMASPKGINIVTENRCKKPPVITGDKDALVRVFNNLLSNAIKFTPKYGEVRLVFQEADHERLCVSVIDTGIGISQSDMPYLFDKFSRVSRAGTSGEKSTGLGLSITRELVNRHNGTIEVKSDVNKGSRFKIYLPLEEKTKRNEMGGDPSEVRCDEIEEPDDIRVLVADDNCLNAKLVGMLLTKKGYEVSTVSNGKEAYDLYVENINRDDKTFDIIFMDLRMPVLDGFEATEEIRKYETVNMMEHVPIVAMTAGTSGLWEIKSQEKGLNGFVTKPVDVQQMKDIINRFVLCKNELDKNE